MCAYERIIILSDDRIRPSVEKHISGTMALEEDETEQIVFDGYFNDTRHCNYAIDEEINGFLCVIEDDDSIFVNFAWHIGTFTTQKKMVKLGKELYKMYTIDKGLPMYYSGLKNFYSNHCEHVGDNVWQFIP